LEIIINVANCRENEGKGTPALMWLRCGNLERDLRPSEYPRPEVMKDEASANGTKASQHVFG
jgi:hypothetical protein